MDDYYHGTGVVIDGRDLDIGYGALKFFFFFVVLWSVLCKQRAQPWAIFHWKMARNRVALGANRMLIQ